MSVFSNQYNSGIVFVDGTELGSNTGGSIPLGLNNAFSDASSLTQATSQTFTGPLVFSGALTMNGAVTHGGAEVQKITIFTTAGNYTVAATDRYVVIRKSVGAATTVTLPASPTLGRILTIKDGKGDSSTNNITIAGGSNSIDTGGTTNITLNVAFASVDLIWDGTVWVVV